MHHPHGSLYKTKSGRSAAAGDEVRTLGTADGGRSPAKAR